LPPQQAALVLLERGREMDMAERIQAPLTSAFIVIPFADLIPQLKQWVFSANFHNRQGKNAAKEW